LYLFKLYNEDAKSISYKYNLNGIRTSKIVNGIKTNYILEGTSIVFEDRAGDMLYYIYNRDKMLVVQQSVINIVF